LKYKAFILLVFILFVSCNFFKETDDRIPIARVNESYLYTEDIEDLIAEGTSGEDSTIRV